LGDEDLGDADAGGEDSSGGENLAGQPTLNDTAYLMPFARR
jgi:hypothetical protein